MVTQDSSIKQTTRYHFYQFYKKFYIFTFLMASLCSFLFLFSWVILFVFPFIPSVSYWILTIVLSLVVTLGVVYIWSAINFRVSHTKKEKKLLSKKKSDSLYTQVTENPRYIYHFTLWVCGLVAIDIFICLAQILQSTDSLLLNAPRFLVVSLFVIKYLVLILLFCIYIFCYKKWIPKKDLYSPLLLR